MNNLEDINRKIKEVYIEMDEIGNKVGEQNGLISEEDQKRMNELSKKLVEYGNLCYDLIYSSK